MKEKGNFLFFWGWRDIPSNWHPAKFTYKGIEFDQNEQWMMYCKAKLFGDDSMAEEILLETDPKKNKDQGRAVKGFNDAKWNAKADQLVMIGLREKYLQNPKLLQWLLSKNGKQFAEASPYDKRWGIGLKDSHPDAMNPDKWPGENRLGKLHDELIHMLLHRTNELPERAKKAVEHAKGEIRRGRYTQSHGPCLN